MNEFRTRGAWRLLPVALMLVLAGCIVENEPNDTSATADTSNLQLLYPTPGYHNGEQIPFLYLGTKEDNPSNGWGGEDQWIIYNNSSFPTQIQLQGGPTDSDNCVWFQVEYCNSGEGSWSACTQPIAVLPDAISCGKWQAAYGGVATVPASRFIRVIVRGTLTGVHAQVKYFFTLGPR